MFKIPFCHLTCLGAVYFPCVQIDSFIPKNNILIYCQDTNSTMTQGGGGSLHCQVEHHVRPKKIYLW